MARILVTGTLAYDDIGVFHEPLAAHTRNVKLAHLHRQFGGCAMNLAYNLRRLGQQPTPLVYVGDDYAPDYLMHVEGHGIDASGIIAVPASSCARGIILTGSDGAQFTAFYPGPTGEERFASDLRRLAGNPPDALIIAPDLPAKMREAAGNGPRIALRAWCPGQYAELLAAEDVRAIAAGCDLLVANRHEWQALCRQVAADDLLARLGEVVVTDGPHPVRLLRQGLTQPVPALASERVRDPTGCGDAFAAALVASLTAASDPARALSDPAALVAAVRAGIEQAQRCLQHEGSQNH